MKTIDEGETQKKEKKKKETKTKKTRWMEFIVKG